MVRCGLFGKLARGVPGSLVGVQDETNSSRSGFTYWVAPRPTDLEENMSRSTLFVVAFLWQVGS